MASEPGENRGNKEQKRTTDAASEGRDRKRAMPSREEENKRSAVKIGKFKTTSKSLR